MTSNLRLGSSSTLRLTSESSDITSDYSLPAVQTSGSTSWASDTTGKVYQQSNTSYGNLYSWYAATAGTGTSSMTSNSATNIIDAPSSICPKGWKLPRSGNTDDYSFKNLIAKGNIKANTITQSPYSFTYSGYYSSGIRDLNSGGRYWSRSAYTTASYAYDLTFSSSHVDIQNHNDKYYGFSVRCVYSG